MRKWLFIFLVIPMVLVSAVASAQQWTHYTVADGLGAGRVYDFCEDSNGNIWFATENGLSVFDGLRFKTYTTRNGLPSDNIISVLADQTGNIWMGTDGGLVKFDGSRFQTFTVDDGLPTNQIARIHQDRNGDLWITTGNFWGQRGSGVVYYNGTTFKNYTMESELSFYGLTAIYADGNGDIWFAGHQLIRYSGQVFEDLAKTYNVSELFPGGYIRWVLRDRKRDMWIGSATTIHRYGSSNNVPLPAELKESLDFTSILEDREGNLWFGTWGNGLIRYDGAIVEKYTIENGLGNNTVFSAFEDRIGNLWFGTEDGVTRYDPFSFRIYKHKNVSLGSYYVYVDSSSIVWIGTRGGDLFRYDGKQMTAIPSNSWIFYIFEDSKGDLLFATGDGIMQLDGLKLRVVEKTYTQFIWEDSAGTLWFANRTRLIRSQTPLTLEAKFGYGGSHHTVAAYYSIEEDTEKNIWYPAPNGLGKYDGVAVKVYTTDDGLISNNVTFVFGDRKGYLWIGTDIGLSRYDGNEFENYTDADGLANGRVDYIFEDQNENLWFCARDGVSRYDGNYFQTFTSANGLGYNRVSSIFQDSNGNLWFLSFGGATKYDGICFQSLTTKDGLPGNNIKAAAEDQEGNIWFSTPIGFTRHVPEKIPPRITIINISADREYLAEKSIELPSSVKRITFSYRGSDFRTRPGQMWYLFQLEGIDSDWQKPTRAEHVDYRNLNPGHYTFRIKAADRDLNYSEPASVEFTILPPPIYTRAGFIVGCILAAFLIPTIIYAFLLIRQKRGRVFETIPNPYIVGNPIRSKGMFFGREDDFRFISDKLVGSPTGLIIVLAGERRSGKTSILYQILNGRLGERFVPVFIDMQAMTIRDDAEFFQQLAQETERALSKSPLTPLFQRGEQGSPGFRGEAHPAQIFQDYIGGLMEEIGDRSLLFLIDEYELLETKVEDGVLASESITLFAALLERHSRIAFVFTGSRHLEKRRAAFWEVLLAKSIARHISFLSESDTHRLVQEPVKGQVNYARNVPEAIYRLTAGQPFYAQVICQNLIDRLNIEERNTAGESDVAAVAREVEDNPLPQMLYFWDSFTKEQQWGLSMLAELQENPDQAIQVIDMLRAAKEYELPIPLSGADWRGTMESLCRRDIVDRVSDQGEYRFKIDLFRPWIRHQHSIWEAVDSG